jgi:nitrate/TMAO reductase-like tetraheme cytochrome c subunit
MSLFKRTEERWLRPFLFFGNNPVSLVGGAITSASALTLIGFWIVDIFGHGGSSNPYLGILVDLFLPGLFVLGLLLIPLGIWLRRRYLRKLDRLPAVYPKIDPADPVFRHGIEFVLAATFINFIIVGTASYRGVAYMDTPSFCGQACHVMQPEWNAYHVSAHSSVACTECHVAPGVPGYLHAKMNGTRQMFMVLLHNYPRPIMADDKIPAASITCLSCHNQDRFSGDKLVLQTTYGDDEKNSITHTPLLLHLGGRSFSGNLSGIHGAHLAHIEYVATDATHKTILSVSKTNSDGSVTDFVSTDAKSQGPVAGEKRVMDCIDCHNRAAHSFDTPEAAIDKAMASGALSPSLPFLHKQGLLLLRAEYASQEDAAAKIATSIDEFYRSQYPTVWSSHRTQIEQAASALTGIYRNNVFPFMKVTWGTHPNNNGHTPDLAGGCFRCHDGNHAAKDGKIITNDCSVCHDLLTADDLSPKQLAAIDHQ